MFFTGIFQTGSQASSHYLVPLSAVDGRQPHHFFHPFKITAQVYLGNMPSLRGGMWYLDVNIQSAFAGTFASNHLKHIAPEGEDERYPAAFRLRPSSGKILVKCKEL